MFLAGTLSRGRGARAAARLGEAEIDATIGRERVLRGQLRTLVIALIVVISWAELSKQWHDHGNEELNVALGTNPELVRLNATSGGHDVDR